MKCKFICLVVLLISASFADAEPTNSAPAFRISAGRAVQLDLKGVSTEEAARFHGTYPVSETGTISLPNLSAPIKAAGLTASELAITIENAYRREQIYKAPKILAIAEGSQQPEELLLTIGGQVRKPGPVKYTSTMTLYQAVEAGGGATEFGAMKRVSLIREGKATVYDLTKNENKAIQMQANDTVEVPEKNAWG